MPTIDWTPEQCEEVRQMILDRMDFLQEREDRWKHTQDAADFDATRRMLQDMRELLKKLEAAYANA